MRTPPAGDAFRAWEAQTAADSAHVASHRRVASSPTADERFMRMALELAAWAVGDTSPNPVVGAVVVKHGRIVGRGHHRRAGLAHAEVEALRQAGAEAKGAVLYVTLEPCNHLGRTPPCCEAILRAGIARVVAAMRDPNPITNGRGLARLRREGVEVALGVLGPDAQRLNAPFAKFITTATPWVVAKIAQSLDGKIATRSGDSQWISTDAARALGHRLRREADAVLVGVNTVLADDPRLTARQPGRRARPGRPITVILDSRLRTPLSSRCLSRQSPPTIIATTNNSASKRAAYERRGARVLVLPAGRDGRVPLARLLKELAGLEAIMSVLIEGGGEVLASALEARLVDRVAWCVAPMLIGGRDSPSSVGGEGICCLREAIWLTDLSAEWVGADLMLEAAVDYPRAPSHR